MHRNQAIPCNQINVLQRRSAKLGGMRPAILCTIKAFTYPNGPEGTVSICTRYICSRSIGKFANWNK